ncbi:MAG TPA: hypothetical protein VH475_13465 [Tepidisphaeraceae bacterium]
MDHVEVMLVMLLAMLSPQDVFVVSVMCLAMLQAQLVLVMHRVRVMQRVLVMCAGRRHETTALQGLQKHTMGCGRFAVHTLLRRGDEAWQAAIQASSSVQNGRSEWPWDCG